MFRFGRLAASWQLVKASWGVLRSDKQLLIFPIVSTLLTILVTITFIVPMALSGIVDRLIGGDQSVRPLGVVVAFAFYIVQYFVIFFANSALVGAALLKLDGRQATAGDGFRIALQHVGPIFGYSIIAATVGMLLRWLRDQGRNSGLGIVTAIVSGILGAAWNIATYLAVPVLVMEGVGPIEAIKRSTGYLKRTWGEQLVGNLGIGLVFGLLGTLAAILGIGLVMAAATTGLLAAIVAAIAIVVVVVLIIALIGATLSGIYRAAVYRYATTGQIGAGFDPALVQGAFRQRIQARSGFGNWTSGGY
jgi:Family of unknown function (DUF6159)